jgi:hypothetical protein
MLSLLYSMVPAALFWSLWYSAELSKWRQLIEDNNVRVSYPSAVTSERCTVLSGVLSRSATPIRGVAFTPRGMLPFAY